MKVLQFVCGRRFVPWLRFYSLLAAAVDKNGDGSLELGPVSGAVLSTRRARSTGPSNRKDTWPLREFASVLEDAS